MSDSSTRSLHEHGNDAVTNDTAGRHEPGGHLRPLTGPIDLSQIDLALIEGRREVREGLVRFLMPYKFAIDEVVTKLNILQQEFTQTGEYNPIEHVTSRLKDPDSIIEKMQRRGVPLDTDLIRETITDIAGVRVVCSFVSDVYRVFDLLTAHADVTIYQVKDYIENPKPNGYRSLHLLLEVPVYLSSGPVQTIVEVQIRTIAMEFWASLEHKIYYKYDREVPKHLLEGLSDAAAQADQLDATMEHLHREIRGDHFERTGGVSAIASQSSAAAPQAGAAATSPGTVRRIA